VLQVERNGFQVPEIPELDVEAELRNEPVLMFQLQDYPEHQVPEFQELQRCSSDKTARLFVQACTTHHNTCLLCAA